MLLMWSGTGEFMFVMLIYVILILRFDIWIRVRDYNFYDVLYISVYEVL